MNLDPGRAAEMPNARHPASSAVTSFTKYIAYCVLLGLIAMTAATLLDVILRYLFNKPLYGLNDIVILAMPVVISGCFPAGLALKSSIAIRFLGNALGGRVEPWLEAFGHLMMCLFVSVMAWQLGIYATELGTRETPLLQLPVQPAWWTATALISLAAMVEFFNFVLAVDLARGASSCAATAHPPPVKHLGGFNGQ